MTQFTTRVVLHDATWEHYDALHGHMEKRGFRRTITADSGETYQLPDAEYDYSGDETRQDVRDKAKAAAAQTGKKCAVLVTESAGRCWTGLEKATK